MTTRRGRRVALAIVLGLLCGIARSEQARAASGSELATESSTTTSAPGAAYNVKVVSDASPDLSDMDSFIASTTSRWATSADKVWALFYWTHVLKRQTAPMVLHGLEVTDPIRNFSDYGFTMCSTISGINQSLYEALGLRHQYWDICNHTVSQVEYDGKFHLVDSSFSNLVTTDDGVTLASLQEVASNAGRLLSERSVYGTSANGFLTGSDSLRSLADFVNPSTGSVTGGLQRAFCETGLKYRDYYYNWDRGHRYVLNLRENESYTRYYRRLGTTPEYWVGTEKVSNPDPALKWEIDSGNRFGIRGNGLWTFSPSFAAADWKSAAYRSANITSSGGALQPAVVGKVADVVYKVQAANAITSQSIQARFARPNAEATATIAVSVNHGLTWTTVAALGTEAGAALPLTAALRNEVSGAYETLVRIQMSVPAGATTGVSLTGLTIDTITQVNTKALPKLNVGRNEMHVSLGNQSDTMVLWPELRGDFWKKDAHASANIASQAVTVPRAYTALVYPAVLNQNAHLTYRMDAPTDITRAVYGGRLYNFQAGSWIEFQHSFDAGATWIPSYRLTDVRKPYDVVHYETVTNIPAGVRSILFRYVIHNTSTTAYRASGLYAARMEVNHRPAVSPSQPIDVTMRWKEVRSDRTLVERSHKQRVVAFPFKYVINIGGSDHPVMESMRLTVADDADPTPFGYSDSVDAGGQKYLHRKRVDGANLAVKKPYTVSRVPSGFQGSLGATNTTVLTDGVVGAPASGSFAYWFGQCWTSGQTVDLDVDLGAVRSIGAVRAHLSGYPFWDALKGQVQDRVEVLTSIDGITFASRGTLQTSLWRKDVPINHMLQDDEKATAWNFELQLPAQVSARYVRYRALPKRNLCISELQVLDRVSYQPFDIRIAPPVDSGTPTDPESDPTTNPDPVPNPDPTPDPEPEPGPGTGPPAGGATEIVLYAKDAVVTGRWMVMADSTAAGGARLQNPDAGAAKLSAPLAAPADFFEMTFTAEAGRPYRLWMRAKATANSWANDAVHVQFDGSIDRSGLPIYRIGSTSATAYQLEDCVNCGLAGWGWQDNGFGAGVLGPLVYFAKTGPQRIRVQVREDGLGIDQIVLSAERFLAEAPGMAQMDTTILPASETDAAPNAAPAIALTAPAAASVFTAPATITVAAAASDSDGTVARVDFYANGTAIGSRTAAPWSIAWNVVTTGTYTITARATDDRGDTTTTPGVVVTVGSQSPGQPPAPTEIVLYARDATIGGGWSVTTDATAAGGARLQNANLGAPKQAALASPAQYFDLTFNAAAGTPYRLWIRGKATSNSWTSDSVSVQFDGSVSASGTPQYRIGTTSATVWTLEDCVSCGMSGWGWQDNGFSEVAGTAGPLIYFAMTGPQRIRIQVREDGVGIDQIVLSAERFLSSAPGATKNDTTIVSR
jgi:Bacterial Ig domain